MGKLELIEALDKYYKECLKRAKVVNADYWHGRADAYRNVIVLIENLDLWVNM